MVFIVRAGRSQSRQQLRRSTVPPPCKQVSHRSPSQSAPGCPPASWLCVRTGLKTQSPAQMTTITAGLVHHILSQQHQNPPPPAPTDSQTAIARGCYRTQHSRASPELLGQMTRFNPKFPLALTRRARTGRSEGALSLPPLAGACAVSHTRCRSGGAGREALKLFADCA